VPEGEPLELGREEWGPDEGPSERVRERLFWSRRVLPQKMSRHDENAPLLIR
jgi:hypothetical protein